ncbi:MAG: pyruvate-flavodoxin oxidoreductase [Gammaproteobacteria bacterium SG8_47]|nr:MAG: pyruvate-flavodoxin oxidoreductase [Gammaproteobacteria bacterium SG8_47]
MLTIDGNEAAASIAYRLSEVCAIYPITPASPMGEWADAWSAEQRPNLWGGVPQVVEMQSEAGAAGAVHGALQTGALTTTFTASQGLLLMIPNMYKIAGELNCAVFHVAARSIATHALSIFGDHSDVMAVRPTGFGLLAAGSVQEVLDLASVAHAASLAGRVPLVHFFDGFRTSHEVDKIEAVADATLRALISEQDVHAHRQRALSPERPVLRGSAQNPDVFFQAREAINPYYEVFPEIVQNVMDRYASLTGRAYNLFDYVGAPDAERVIVVMGSAAEACHETVAHLNQHGERVGLIKVRLYRPFCAAALMAALPDTVRAIAVLDRTKEPGADGEPLYKDVVTAVAQDTLGSTPRLPRLPRVVGGRYGLSSKEFTPGMVKSVFDELAGERPRNHFSVGIIDDVSNASLAWDESFRTDANSETFQAVFYGLGADGTVSANKNSIKIIGDATDLFAQGYFVYDSKKSGAVTVSHLRFGPHPIRSTYLVGDGDAQFVACHQPVFLERYDMLDKAAEGAVFLLNSPTAPAQVWNTLPRAMQQQMIAKRIRLFTIDAYAVAEQAGMGKRINTVMQTCFFAISGVLPREQAIAAIKNAVEKTYGRKGRRIVEFNFRAIDAALANLHEVAVPAAVSSVFDKPPAVGHDAPAFVREFTAALIAGHGDRVPVSALAPDGTFPLGTAAYEKRNLALRIPVWEPDLCTHCGKCPLVCPHGVIRSKAFPAAAVVNAPPTFKHVPIKGKDFPEGYHISYQVAPEDCTGCELCVDICPIHDKSNVSRKALNMAAQPPLREAERANWAFFLSLPEYDRREVKLTTLKGSMLLQPLFEFSGACEGCGETPYVKLASQLFGDRMVVANATGCSSIYGGNLPTTPWTTNREGRGPAWSNSLFEDNAEFGFGMRVSIDQQARHARELLAELAEEVGADLAQAIRDADQRSEADIHAQRERVAQLRQKLAQIGNRRARALEALAENLIRKSVWIIGGDGWAYDIGYGGLDHVLASGADVNILVLDTEVYSNTGGQTSKATPRGAVAKFSAGGKPTAKKDLAMLAMGYENVYVAHVAYGAKDVQTLRAFIEAEAHPGPSLIIAYSPCIAHGVDLKHNHRQQQLAVDSGHWPLFRFDPSRPAQGKNPLHLDSAAPSVPYRDFVNSETRFNMLWRSHPEDAERFLKAASHEVHDRYHRYAQLAELEWESTDEDSEPTTDVEKPS